MQSCELEEGEIQAHEEEEKEKEDERKRGERRQKRKKRCKCRRNDEGGETKKRRTEKEREGRTRNGDEVTDQNMEKRDRDRKADRQHRTEHRPRDDGIIETPSDSDLSVRVRRLLCSSGGSMELERLGPLLGVSLAEVERMVENEQGHSLMLKEQNGKRVAVSRSAVRVCTQRMSKCPGECKNLHLCRYHVLGKCNRNPCAFGHDVRNDRNLEVLKMYELEELSKDELLQLVLQNDPSFLPEVCQHYNRGKGLHGSCDFKSDCQKLHVCQYFLDGKCKYASRCIRSHSLSDPQAMRQLEKWGISEDLVPQLPNIYRNASALRDTRAPLPKPKPPGSAKKGYKVNLMEDQEEAVKRDNLLAASVKETSPGFSEEICVYYLNDICTYGDNCSRVHYHLPYRWQIQLSAYWEDMENMEDTEHAYCNINRYPTSKIQECGFNFDTMTYKSYKIRRLSTPSSLCKSPELILTTEWCWYWENRCDSWWNEYGKERNPRISDVCSADLEKVYLSDKEGTFYFKAGDEEYEIQLKNMVQMKLSTGTKRRICRRPRFVSAEKSMALRSTAMKCQKSYCGGSRQDEKAIAIPKHWDRTNLLKVKYKLVSLDQIPGEFNKVKSLFHRSLRTVSIIEIERIQNASLWRIYQRRKQQMEKQKKGREVKERQLFYAADDSLVATICQKNFDCGTCGIHGATHGNGSCFATNAYYSHINTPRNFIRTHAMFIASVLVGDSTEWNPSTQSSFSTSKAPFSSMHDSCVDSLPNPTVFTLFDNHQIYPEYVIRFL
ncbi:protein mono-ADP-ribosyltransferase PARP12-like [Spea bombifrons]|uniref:protein mono-ADP-ribosyltransferase PARP12-like n=1 Tax=Spea bombifrons TaxID=233779 RepID=UPI0023499CEC|nr:protein mono-ADP-ribosyltransferase PARP12-like [Spea bombifrons]